jgi:hypothetical protein
MTLMMIVVSVAVVALVIAAVWYVIARGSEATTVTKRGFGEAYDELVAKGEVVDQDRDAAWKAFHSWQATNEEERQSWEEHEPE